jgi:hypothetical protein
MPATNSSTHPSNLDFFRLLRAALTHEQQEIFPHCFIGALSSSVSPEIWQSAVETGMRSACILCPEHTQVHKGEQQPWPPQ